MCPIGFLMLGSTLQDLPSDSPAACRSACRRRQASLYTRLPPTNDPRVHAAYPGRPRGRAGTAQPPPTTTARSKPTPRLAQQRLRQLQARGADSGRPRAGHGRSWRPPRPRPSQPYGCLPHRRAPPHFGRTQRTRQPTNTGRPHRTPESGRRTADTWTLRRPHRTLDTGPVDRQAWTLVTGHGHCTPDAGRGRGQADEGAAGIRTSWATTPSDRTLGRPTVFLWTAPAALDSPCRLGGEAAFQREIASRRQLLGRSAGVERRLGALLSSDNCRSSVERTAKVHPLWRVHEAAGASAV
jgi:hypothetical protein